MTHRCFPVAFEGAMAGHALGLKDAATWPTLVRSSYFGKGMLALARAAVGLSVDWMATESTEEDDDSEAFPWFF